ncbi:MAG: APC family permease [Treponema sp.]
MRNRGKQKGLSAVDFFCIGFGAIVGVGWAVSINSWMTNCGGPVPAGMGYILVLIMMVPIALCYCELVPMLPVAGGGMAFAYKAFNDKVSIISGWAAFGAFVAIIPWEAIQITDVLGYIIPSLKSGAPLYRIMGSDIYLDTIIIGVICSLLIFALNMRGLAAAAFVQKILCFVLIGTALISAAAALIGGNSGNWHPIYDTTNPAIYGEGLKTVSHKSLFGGMFAIVASAAFFLSGFETIPQGVEDSGGDVKHVGVTVVLSVILACIFYAILLFCFGYGWKWQEFTQMPHPAAAAMFLRLFPGKTGDFLYWLLIIGAIAGLFTTWNGFFTAAANLLMGMSRGRLISEVFAKQNKKGIAVNGQIVCLFLSCMGPFLGPNLIESITSFSATAFVLSWTITAWSLVRLRRKYPAMNRPYKIPGGIGMGLFAGMISSLVFIFMFVKSSPFYIGKLTVTMFTIWMSIGIILYLVAGKRRKGLGVAELEKGVFGTEMPHLKPL